MATLNDAEIYDLAHRTAALPQDVVAGQTYGPNFSGLGTALVVAGVVVVLIIALLVFAIVKITD